MRTVPLLYDSLTKGFGRNVDPHTATIAAHRDAQEAFFTDEGCLVEEIPVLLHTLILLEGHIRVKLFDDERQHQSLELWLDHS
jgi:hypothetical protein